MPGSPVKRARKMAAASGGDVVAAGEEAKRRTTMDGKLRVTAQAQRVAEMGDALRSSLPVPVVVEGLTEKERAFVQNKALGMSNVQAARHAGYASPRSEGDKLAVRPAIAGAVTEQRTQYEEAGRITKKRVLDGFLEAIDQAKLLTDPIAQIAGWREIAKVCGYYEPTKHELAVSVQGNLVVQKIQALSDDELLRLAEGDVIEGEIIGEEKS